MEDALVIVCLRPVQHILALPGLAQSFGRLPMILFSDRCNSLWNDILRDVKEIFKT